MHRSVWILAGVGAAVMLFATSATATTKAAGSARSATLAAAPFARSWADVPRTAAGRKAKSVLVFGMEQDVAGFNVLNANSNGLWASITGVEPTIRGIYIIDNNGTLEQLVIRTRALYWDLISLEHAGAYRKGK